MSCRSCSVLQFLHPLCTTPPVKSLVEARRSVCGFLFLWLLLSGRLCCPLGLRVVGCSSRTWQGPTKSNLFFPRCLCLGFDSLFLPVFFIYSLSLSGGFPLSFGHEISFQRGLKFFPVLGWFGVQWKSWFSPFLVIVCHGDRSRVLIIVVVLEFYPLNPPPPPRSPPPVGKPCHQPFTHLLPCFPVSQ